MASLHVAYESRTEIERPVGGGGESRGEDEDLKFHSLDFIFV